jgi:hypothetical protein
VERSRGRVEHWGSDDQGVVETRRRNSGGGV